MENFIKIGSNTLEQIRHATSHKEISETVSSNNYNTIIIGIMEQVILFKK